MDRVRESLSYNDITVSQNKDLIQKQLNDVKTRQNVTNFYDHLYDIITSTTLNVIQENCVEQGQACINAVRKTEADPPRSRVIDTTFFDDK